MKKLILGAAVSSLMLSTALAQTATPDPQSSPTPPAASGNSSGAMNFVPSQKSDQFLASKFKGTDVIGADNAKIGDVSDLLFDKSGKIEAFVVSVGGFLGVGAKDVAIAPSAFEVVRGANNEPDKLKLSATRDQLKQAQNFEPYQAPRMTTGAGGAGSMGGGLGGARPPASSPASPSPSAR